MGDEEVWLNPQKLPDDLGSATLRLKDEGYPSEWFHLPKGATVPTVEDLLRDSSPEPDESTPEGRARARSPPICGRARSKSRGRSRSKSREGGGKSRFLSVTTLNSTLSTSDHPPQRRAVSRP